MTPTPPKARRHTNASNWLRHFIFLFVTAVFDGCKYSEIRQKQRTACPCSRSSAKCGIHGWPGDAHHSRRMGHQSWRPREAQRGRQRNPARIHAVSRSSVSRLSLVAIERQRHGRWATKGTDGKLG